MAMVDRRWQRLSTLCALYVAQGVPWGFMTISLITYLTAQGVSTGEAGTLTAIVLIPWTFKLVWAPLIDSVTIRSMGRRRAWIIGAEMMMAVTLLGLMLMGDLTQDLALLGWMFFLHNCFASLQDVCTDALAVDVLPFAEQGSANGLMWGSKLLGKGAGAATLAWVMSQWGLSTAVMVQFFLLLGIMLFPLLILERPGEKRLPWSKGAAVETGEVSSVRNPLHVLLDLLKGFSLRATFVFAIFAVTKLIGSAVNEIVTKTLYTQELGWDFVEVSTTLGFYGIVPILLGAMGGGFLANRFGRRTIICAGFGGYALVALIFAMNRHLWDDRWFTTTYLLATEGLLAAAAVGFLSMSMRITWTRAAATMFTTYMTLSNIGHVIGNRLAGPVQDLCSSFFSTERLLDDPLLPFAAVFGLVAAANLVPMLLLPFVDPEEVDVFKFPKVATASADADSESAAAAVEPSRESCPTCGAVLVPVLVDCPECGENLAAGRAI